jgi:LmbE family N-acetylglucosaminyl deacetylase
MKTTFEQLQPKVILGVAAHPDDLDFGMSGSIATWVKQGAKAYYLILTNGNKGSEDRNIHPNKLRDIRRNEQRKAAKILGVADVFFCDYEDGDLTCCSDSKRDIAKIIRQVQPDVVLTMDPTMVYSAQMGFINHPDHRAAGQATLDAVYPHARDHLAFPDLLQDGLEPHAVETVLLINFDKHNYCVDVSEVMETKLRALGAHESQFKDKQATLDMIRNHNAKVGKECGCKYAEAFVRIDIE